MKLRGNCPAKVDEKGRLKIPAVFLEQLKEFGNQFYITSTSGETARIYPMKVWSEIEDKLAKMPSTNRAKRKFLMRTSYYGQTVELDGQGRLLLPTVLRESASDEWRVARKRESATHAGDVERGARMATRKAGRNIHRRNAGSGRSRGGDRREINLWEADRSGPGRTGACHGAGAAEDLWDEGDGGRSAVLEDCGGRTRVGDSAGGRGLGRLGGFEHAA